MKRRFVLLVVGAVVASVALTAAPTASAKPKPEAGPTVYVGELTPEQLKQLSDLGLDRSDISARQGATKDTTSVEVVLQRRQAAKLNSLGLKLKEKEVGGTTVSKRLNNKAASGYTVFRSYSEDGGIRDELIALARQYPKLTKLVSIGKTVNGQKILAIKVTKNASQVEDGSRPSVLYSSTQHAREWITTEMNRRLLHYYLEKYATNAAIQRVVDKTELWFVPVANPDGYDYTFTEGNPLVAQEPARQRR